MGVGTMPYMAPEQFTDFANVTAAADIYSFGIMRMRVGFGSAVGVILFCICVAFAFGYKRWIMRDE